MKHEYLKRNFREERMRTVGGRAKKVTSYNNLSVLNVLVIFYLSFKFSYLYMRQLVISTLTFCSTSSGAHIIASHLTPQLHVPFEKKIVWMLRTDLGPLEQEQTLLTSDQLPQPLVLCKVTLFCLIIQQIHLISCDLVHIGIG